jgi:ABC-2 type transport system ATP-binding protein
MISIRGLFKSFGTRRALDDITFDIVKGEILGLIGPNGAGKTTLLECLSGLLLADRGRVECGGRFLSVGERKRVLFYLPDAVRPGGGARVWETFDFFRVMFGRSPADLRRAIEKLDLAGALGDRVEDLSKGTLKRFLLAPGRSFPPPASSVGTSLSTGWTPGKRGASCH